MFYFDFYFIYNSDQQSYCNFLLLNINSLSSKLGALSSLFRFTFLIDEEWYDIP